MAISRILPSCVAISRILPPPPEYANVPMPAKMQSSTVVAQLLGLFLFNSVPMCMRMCLCVLSPYLFVRLLVALVLCRVGLLVIPFEEPVGVFPFSLSATLASVVGSSCSNVLWTNRVQSCLSVSPRLGFLGLFCSSFLSCWRLFSILVTSSSFPRFSWCVSAQYPGSQRPRFVRYICKCMCTAQWVAYTHDGVYHSKCTVMIL